MGKLPRQESPSDEPSFIAGDALKTAALRYSAEMRPRVENEQSSLFSAFDGWSTRVASRPPRCPRPGPRKAWTCKGICSSWTLSSQERDGWLRQLFDRWQRDWFVEYSKGEASAAFYQPRFGTEYSIRAVFWSIPALPTISAATPPASPIPSSSERSRLLPRPRLHPITSRESGNALWA
jgi:hypothetical protein